MTTLLVAESDCLMAQVIADRFRRTYPNLVTRIATSMDEVREVFASTPIDVALVRHSPDVGPTLEALRDGARAPRVVVLGVPPGHGDVARLRDEVEGVVEGDAGLQELIEAVEAVVASAERGGDAG